MVRRPSLAAPEQVRRGRGGGSGFKGPILAKTSVAFVKIYAYGQWAIYRSRWIWGGLLDTAMEQIVAEVLKLAGENCGCYPDTDVTPYDMATIGSRSTISHGQRGENGREGRQAESSRDGARRSLPKVPNLEDRAISEKNACRPAT